jgi:hypothetical protein
MSRPILAAAALAFTAFMAVPAAATEVYSVLVGASDYHLLEKALRDAGDTQADRVNLKGARNDAILMAQTLISRGAKPGNLTLLIEHPEAADYPLPTGLKPAGAPTRAAIAGAMEGLATKAKKGDQVVILLSGHGSQQPQRGTLEADGLDEIFIPVDHGLWTGGKSVVENAIVDDEIAEWIDHIRAKGADVVFIGDFCHSGDSVRGNGTGPAGIDFQKLLGIPKAALDKAATAAMQAFKGRPGQRESRVEVARGGAGQGDFVAFMAAAADTRADQVLGPVYLPRDQRKPDGVLTMYLAAALSDPSIKTYREAATRVQVGYSAQNVPSTPEFEGDLDKPVLGAAGTAGLTAWTVAKPQAASFTSLTLNAGALQGVSQGSIIALSEVQLNKGGQEAVILYGKVDTVGPGTAQLVPVAYGDIPAERWSDVRNASGARFGWSAFLVARVVQNGAQFGFDVARPAAPAAPTKGQQVALTAIDALSLETVGVKLKPAGAGADYAMTFEGDALVLRQSPAPGVVGSEIGRISLQEASSARDPSGFLRQRIGDALSRTVRAAKLQRVVATMNAAPKGETASADPATALAVETRVWLAPEGSGKAGSTCPAAPEFSASRDFPTGASSLQDLGWTTADAPRLHPCDTVYIKLKNGGQVGTDVTGLVIQPTGAVSALKDPVYGVRLEGGSTGVYAWQFDPLAGDTPAVSDIAFIVVQADPAVRIHADYSNLAQCAATDFTCSSGGGATRSSDQTFAQGRARGFAEMMDGVLDGQTRSGAVGQSVGSSGVISSSWLLAPRR